MSLMLAFLIVLTISASAIPAIAAPLTQQEVVADPIDQTISTEADAWLDANLSAIQDRQAQYYNNHRVYWQGLDSHLDKPTYGEGSKTEDVAKEPDNITASPTDVLDTWLDIFPEFQTEKMPATLTIDVYDGPEGAGYVLTLSLIFKNEQWFRAIQFGPESWREHGWQQISVEVVQ